MKQKPNSFSRRSIVIAGALSCTVSAAFADTISPSVDLRVISPNPNTNDPGALSLFNDGGNVQRSFLQFNLGSYSGGSITTDATLTLVAGIFGNSLTGVSIGTADSPWTQGGATPITWNNQPGITPIPGATNPSGTFGSGPVTWTIPWYILEKMATAVTGYDNGLGITSGFGSTQHFESTGSGTAPTLTFSAATGAGSTWTGGNGNWTDTANWAGSTVAEGIGQAATINGGTAVDITMDANRSVGSISFSGADHIISSGAGKLALNVVSGSPTISVEATRTATISAELIGLDGLTKTDSGKLALSGANTYSGATTVSGGTLALQSAYPSSSFAISSGATLELNVDSGSRDLASTTFSGTGTLSKTGAGSVIWGPASATFALGAGSLIDVQEGAFGAGSFGNENWTGNLAGLNVASGAFFMGVEANVRVDALTGAGYVSSGYPGAGYQNFTFGVNDGSGTFSGTLADSDSAPANFVKAGSGTQTLTGMNSYTGSTTVLGGTLSLGNGTTNTNLSDGATVSIASGTTVNLNFTGSDTVGKLIIDGETLPGGVYDGSLSTPLPYRDYFTGTGSLTVLEQDGTWTSTVDGNWSNSANWLSNLVATGLDNTATFSAGTGSETITVTLDSNREIANLAFSNANYTITGNTLTLNSSTTLSTLSVASGNTATISSALAGTPDVDKTGDGTLTLSGGLNYSGTTTVSGGTLQLQDPGVGGGSNYNGGELNIKGASTLRVFGPRYNFNGKTFTFDSTGGGTIDAISSGAGGFVFMGNNTFATSGGAQNIISGTRIGFENQGFNLNGQTAIFEVETGLDAISDLKVIGTIWNGGNVTKNGAGRMEISAPQGYSGTTTVNGGTLILGDGANNIGLPDTEDLVVESGAALQLNYDVGNPDTIDELWLGGVQQSPGIYGAGTYSGVTITGTGTLNVQNGPITDPFANWMATNYPTIVAPDNLAGADPDDDGIENLIEYVLQGGDPSVPTTGILPTLDASGANFVFTYLRRAAATGTTQTFQYGTDLTGWTDLAIPGGAGVVVTDLGGGIDEVEITVDKGINPKLFGRLLVTQP